MGLATLRRYHNLPAPASVPNEKPVIVLPDKEHTRIKESVFRTDKVAERIQTKK